MDTLTEKSKPMSIDMPTDSAGTHLLETIGVVTLAGALVLIGWNEWALAITATLLCAGALWWALNRRRRQAVRNEHELRDRLYSFPAGRSETLKLVFPVDVVDAVVSLQTEPTPRLAIKQKLTSRLGDARANEYLPLLLRYADQHQERV